MTQLPKDGLVFAMDIGTSSLRTALFNKNARRAPGSASQQFYRLRTASDGTAELSASTLLAAAKRAAGWTLSNSSSSPIVAWGTSCLWHGLLGLDSKFAAITPIYTWADSRCLPDAARLREDFPEGRVHARTGCMLRACYWPAKLAWLKRTQRSLFRRVSHWVSPAEFIMAQFCETLLPSFSMNSGAGLVNLERGAWDDELCAATGFVPKHSCGSDGTLRARAKYPRLGAAAIFPAIGDGAAGNLGSGATESGLAAVNYGTSSAARVVMAGAYKPAPPGLFCYAIDRDRWLIGGATSNAGNLFQWALETFRVSPRMLDRSLQREPRPSASLTALPFLNPERAPTWCEEMRGAITGIGQSHTGVDLCRALMDATYLRLAQIVEPLEGAARAGKLRFVISGGASRSPAAMQRLANALGRECLISREHEASLRGAAIYALSKLGLKEPAASWSAPIKPERALARSFSVSRLRQAALEERLRSALL